MWSRDKNNYHHYSKVSDVEFLDPGIYELKYGPMGSMYLLRLKDKYEFPYKLYGHDNFPERVITTFNSTSGNLGVILSGLKGTGKTVQAEQICNLANLPVILVTDDYEDGTDLAKYLTMINQDVVVMIDEYEKVFGDSDGLLSIMDGAQASEHRRLFVMTMNNLKVADALLDRPSRVHYLKKFKNLSVDVINEVLADLLEDKTFHTDIVEYLESLKIVTIDIVKTVVNEVNRFKESPKTFRHLLNMSPATRKISWNISTEQDVVLYEGVYLVKPPPYEIDNSVDFYQYDGSYHSLGYITAVDSTGAVVTVNGCKFKITPAPMFVLSRDLF